jgi:hypothetical protein
MYSFAVGTFYYIQGQSSWSPHYACIILATTTLVCVSTDAMEYLLLLLSHRDEKTITWNKWYVNHGEGIHDHYSCTCNEVCNIQEHDCKQPSDKCSTNLALFSGLTQLWMSLRCPKLELSLWHAKCCLKGLCSNYGVDSLKVCQKSLFLANWFNGRALDMKL